MNINIKTALILGVFATLSPVSEASQCDPDLKKLESAFEVFFPGQGESYTKNFYLASEIKEELKKLFKVCAVKNHPDKPGGRQERMVSCNNATEYLDTHFTCLENLNYSNNLYFLMQQSLQKSHLVRNAAQEAADLKVKQNKEAALLKTARDVAQKQTEEQERLKKEAEQKGCDPECLKTEQERVRMEQEQQDEQQSKFRRETLEKSQREQAQREQAQREQAQREQAQREQVQREQVQREQETLLERRKRKLGY